MVNQNETFLHYKLYCNTVVQQLVVTFTIAILVFVSFDRLCVCVQLTTANGFRAETTEKLLAALTEHENSLTSMLVEVVGLKSKHTT